MLINQSINQSINGCCKSCFVTLIMNQFSLNCVFLKQNFSLFSKFFKDSLQNERSLKKQAIQINEKKMKFKNIQTFISQIKR